MSKWWVTISATLALLLSIVSLPFLGLFTSNNVAQQQVADLIVTNGTIYTSDDALPYVESMAILNGRIIRIGNYSSLKNLAGPGCRELNLDGKIVVPGFIDSHVHLIFGGLQMARVQLRGVKTKDQFLDKVKEAVKNKEKGAWLLGGGWNNDFWGGELPMASWIDEITPHNPVWLSRMDGHMGLANTFALKVAGISKYTNDPDGGAILRNNDAEPTGLLIDSAMKLILSCLPEVSVEDRRDALFRAGNLALRRGVTTVVDVGRYFPGLSVEPSWEDFTDVYTWADSYGKMLIRVCLFFPMETWARLHLDFNMKILRPCATNYSLCHKGSVINPLVSEEYMNQGGPRRSEKIYLGGLKAFADGSLGSGSALFHEPYIDEPDNFGLEVADMDSLHDMIGSADKSGLQVTIHAIGDKANSLILDMYASVVSQNGIRDRRFRIEHAQHLAPGAASRFGEQAVIASVQPDHMLDDADSAIKKLGSERAENGSYPFQSLLAGGATLAFGSDWPVSDINPLSSIRTAMKRIPPGWDRPWASSERMNLNDALKAHTIWAAYSCFLEKEVGSLSLGKLADFTVLSTNSWESFAEGSVAVEATYVGGFKTFP